MAYGAKGISYWQGLTHGYNAGDYKFEFTFEKDVLEDVKKLHAKLLINSNTLLSLNFASAYHVSDTTTIKFKGVLEEDGIKVETIEPFCVGLTNFAKDPYAQIIFSNLDCPFYPNGGSLTTPKELLITFLVRDQRSVYFWVVNKSLTETYHLKGNFKSTISIKDAFEGTTVNNNTIITLTPGEGRLFAASTPYNDKTIVDKKYGNEFGGLERFDLLIFERNVFESGAVKTFVAEEEINIQETHIKEGSLVRFKASTPTNVKPGRTNAAARTDSHNTASLSEESRQNTESYISPNPIVDNRIHLYLDLADNEEAEVTLYDSMGNLLKRLRTADTETCIPLENPLPGIYFLYIQQGNRSHSLKVIKN